MTHQQRAAGERQRADAVQGHRPQHDPRGAAAGQNESAGAHAARVEHLHAFTVIRRVGDREAAVERDVERTRLDHATVLGADLHQFRRRRAGLIHRIHGVAAPIEHVVLAVGGLLESDRLAKQSDDVRRQ